MVMPTISRIADYVNINDAIAKIVLKLLFPKLKDDRWVAERLHVGNELCKERMLPMSSQLIQEVRRIYRVCAGLTEQGDTPTPLMMALDRGLMNMVWGFIECAKQTNSNLLTRERGDAAVEEFLWFPNKSNGKTAFDLAIAMNHVEVAKLLLSNASLSRVKSLLSSKGKSLFPLLNDFPKYDGVIFDMLEKQKQEMMNPPTSLLIDDSTQESIIDIETLNVPRDLDPSLLGLNSSDNIILHLVSILGDVKYVEHILETHPSLISCRNANEETPAYVAARDGHVETLRIMINKIRDENTNIESIFTRSLDKHNALHIAIQNHHVEVVFLLMEEIPQLANHINDSNQSPLYLTAERRYFEILKLILKKCKEINIFGPNDKTALHAAAISNSTECIEYLLNVRPNLLNLKDEYGWTPLYHAVYHNNSLATEKLLNADHSIGYELITQYDIKTSVIHIAASRGYWETMKVLMAKCRGCSKFIDSKGRNILHVAVENKKKKAIEFIFQDKSLTSLINQKDSNGNTPIHLLVAYDYEMMEKVMDGRVDIGILNNDKLTPLDMTSSQDQRDTLTKGIAMSCKRYMSPNTIKGDYNEKETEAKVEGYESIIQKFKAKTKEEVEVPFKLVDNLVIVATLIATASFAAGITVPGGLHSDDKQVGTPFLLKKAAFQVFSITNAISFSCSSAVLLSHVRLLGFRGNFYDEAPSAVTNWVMSKMTIMYSATGVALVMMVIAFVTGVYVTLTPTLGLAIFICIITFIIIFGVMKVRVLF